MIKKHILFLLSIFFINLHVNGQSHSGPIKFIEDAPKATVMVVGVFHFDNPGLDDYKPEYQMDILSDERQAEIRELVNKLEDFRPTKIGLEFKYTAQARIDSLYNLTGMAILNCRPMKSTSLGSGWQIDRDYSVCMALTHRERTTHPFQILQRKNTRIKQPAIRSSD